MGKYFKRFSVFLFLLLTIFIFVRDKEIYGESAFDLPSVISSSLKNGVKLFYIKDDLPQTVVYATIGYGKLYENEKNAGASQLLTGMLSVSGTAKYRGNELYKTLEDVGGKIEFVSGWENLIVQVKVLSRHTDLAFDILGDVLSNPLFSQEGLDTVKSLAIQKIRRDRDNPESRAFSKLREIIFAGRGYGANTTEESITAIDLATLKNIWNTYCCGENISIAVSSSLSENNINNLMDKNLSSLSNGKRIYYDLENDTALENVKNSRDKIFLIPMKLQQATIVTGTLAPAIHYEGNYALEIMNYILGGSSFNSRLTTEIRVRRGLAYSVFSLVRNRYKTGIFMTFVQTKNASVPQAISLTLENITKIYNSPVSDIEINRAKESINNSFIFRFNSTESIVSHYLDIDYNNFSPDYYEKYLGNINRVTGDDIKREGNKLFSGGLVTVVAGSRDLERVLHKFGQVVICE